MPKRKIENKMIEVILLESNKHLGEKFEIIRVKPIYARNVLFPKNLAILADDHNKHNYAKKMQSAAESRKKKAHNFEDLFMKIHEEGGLKIIRKANKDNTLYAKVDENDIAQAINEIHGVEIEAHLIKLKKKISAVGKFNVPFIYKEIKKEIEVLVEAEEVKKDKHDNKVEEVGPQEAPKKTKEEMKAERDAERAKKKAETIKRLKEKYK